MIFKKIIEDKKILIKSLWVIVILNIGNIISLIIQIYLSRNLNSSDFTIYYSAIALANLLATPLIHQNILIQENLANLNKNKEKIVYYINQLIKVLLIISFFYFLFFIYKYFFLNTSLKLNIYLNFILFLIILFTILNIIPTAYLTYRRKYHVPGLVFTILDFFKLILIFFLVKYSNPNNLIVIFIISLLFIFSIFMINFFFMKKDMGYEERKFNIFNKTLFVKFTKYLFYSLCIPIFLNGDILVVNYLFDADSASQFIIASTLSKITYFLFGGIYIIIFNEFKLQKNMYQKLGFIFFYLFSIFGSAIFLFFFSELILKLLYDSKYIAAKQFFIYLIPAMCFFSILNIFSNILIANNKFKFIIIFYLHFLILIVLSLNLNLDLISFSKLFMTISISLFVLVSGFFCYYLYDSHKKI